MKAQRDKTLRITKWLVSGPWVMETPGAFETEHIYGRMIILDEDYLGGEGAVRPAAGDRVQNRYLVRPEIEWEYKEGGGMRFDTGPGHMYYEGDHADLYRTVARNCVYYVGAYVEFDEDTDAVVTLRHSGVKAFLNGEAVYCCTEGIACGLENPNWAFPARFKAGKNFLMFKLRPGHFADRVEFSMSDVDINPVILSDAGVGVTAPAATGWYFGSREEPRQGFRVLAGAFGASGGVELKLGDCALELGALSAGDVVYAMPDLPAGKEPAEGEFTLAVGAAKRPVRLTVTPFEDFDGTDYDLAHFHFDTTYHEEQRIYALGAIGLVKKYMDYLREDPDFKASLSEIDYLHPYFSLYPEDRKTILDGFAAGRLESDTFYNQPNELTSSAEGLVRNAVYGQLYHRDLLGRKAFVFNPLDVYGHPNQLSQICSKVGCTSVTWTKEVMGFAPLFRHMSPDGTALIHRKTHFGRDYAKKANIKAARGGGIPNVSFGSVRQVPADWAKHTLVPIKFAVPSDFHGAIIKSEEENLRQGRPAAELTSRDMSRYHNGTAISKSDLKIANRTGDNLTLAAEKLSAVAALLGAKYPERALDKAWRQLLCGQHHDSITGTNNEMSYIDLMCQYREAISLSLDVLKNAAEYIASKIALRGGDGIPAVLFNTHAWDRTDRAELRVSLPEEPGCYALFGPEGEELPLEEVSVKKADGRFDVVLRTSLSLPSLGYVVCTLKKTGEGRDYRPEKGGCTIENEFYRVTADESRGGGLTSIYDKLAKKEIVRAGEDGPANRIAALKEDKYRSEPTHEFYTSGEKAFSSDFPARVRADIGAVSQTLTVEGHIGTLCRTRQTVTLTKGVKRIDFRTEILNYSKKDHLFTVTFPVNVAGAKPVFDDRYAAMVGMESRGKLDFRTHQMFMFSHSQVFPANQWMDYGQTVRLSLPGRRSINIGMTSLIRSPLPEIIPASDALLTALTGKSVPVAVHTDSTEAGWKEYTYETDLMNTDTRILLDIEGRENAYTKKLLARFPGLEGCRTAVLKDADNIWNKPLDVILIRGKDGAELAGLVEKLVSPLSRGWKISLPDAVVKGEFGKAEDYGVALINRGNTACSVERGGLLNLMLFHTAIFYGNIKQFSPEGFVTEQKSHIYEYSLLPHTGSYREAEVCRAGYEFNDPVLALTDVKPGGGSLPMRKSFLRSSKGVTVTALKAGKYPGASFTDPDAGLASRGITLRCYEPNGVKTRAGLEFGFPVSHGRRADLLEDPVSALRTLDPEVGRCSIETFTFEVAPEKGDGKVIGAEKELCGRVCSRSWEHSMGSMPMGFLSAAGFIGRRIESPDPLTDRLSLSMANNRRDRRISGSLRLELPEGIRADKTVFKYDLAPLEAAEFPVTFTKTPGFRGAVYMFYEDAGQEFYDFLEFGGLVKPECSFEFTGCGTRLTLENKTAQRLIGTAMISSPVELFDRLSPWCFGIDLMPGEKKCFDSLIKDFDADDASFWVAAKVAVNGSLEYRQLTKRAGARRRFDMNGAWNSGLMEDRLRERGGGLEAYMKLNSKDEI